MKKIIIALVTLVVILFVVFCRKETASIQNVSRALPGAFSISETKKVHFSKGNLYYDGSKFDFEANQYDFHVYDFNNNTMGLLGWVGESSTKFISSPEIYGVSTSYITDNYGNVPYEPLKANWGKAIEDGNTWRTLTIEEWVYLLQDRENADKKVGYATVSNVHGIIILPDSFTDPNKNNGSKAFVPKSTEGWDANVYTSGGNWEAMEEAGALFLPAAGCRSGSYVLLVGNDGIYWSSSAYKKHAVCGVSFCNNDVLLGLCVGRHSGYSVRLITEL